MSTPDPSSMERWKEDVRQDWTKAAGAWRKWHPQLAEMGRAVTDTIIQVAQVTPGTTVLDLASGTGEPALSISEVVGLNGHVTATDLVPQMLEVAEENALQRGITNITFQQADAESLPFPDRTFDVVTCRFGVMFFPNIGQALREIHRVVRPGGRVAFIAWGPRDQNPFFSRTMGVIMKYMEEPPPDPDAPNPFKFAQPGTLSAVLEAAGFQQVVEESRSIPWPWPGPVENAWESFQDLTGLDLDRLEPEQREKAETEVLAALQEYYDGECVNFPAVIVVASALRP